MGSQHAFHVYHHPPHSPALRSSLHRPWPAPPHHLTAAIETWRRNPIDTTHSAITRQSRIIIQSSTELPTIHYSIRPDPPPVQVSYLVFKNDYLEEIRR